MIVKEEEKRATKSSNQKGQSKKTNIEVLDDERPIEQYYEQHKQHHSQNRDNNDSESGDLLKKLIENINGNPAL